MASCALTPAMKLALLAMCTLAAGDERDQPTLASAPQLRRWISGRRQPPKTPLAPHRRNATAVRGGFTSLQRTWNGRHRPPPIDYFPGGSCNNASNATWAPLTLITTLPGVPENTKLVAPSRGTVNVHFYDGLLAIGENARGPSIVAIHVLLDEFSGSDTQATEALRESIAAEQQRRAAWKGRRSPQGWKPWFPADARTELVKVKAHVVGSQPTYSDMFRFACRELPNRTVGITNSDVVLRNPEILDYDAFSRRSSPPFALCISLRKPSIPYTAVCQHTHIQYVDRCINEWGEGRGGASWDVLVFQSPLVNPRYEFLDELEPLPVYMNSNSGEQRTGYFLVNSGYRLYNPCLKLVAEHWHCTKQTHHSSLNVGRLKNETTDEYFNVYSKPGGMVLARADTPGIICDHRLRAIHREQQERGPSIHVLTNATLAGA